ncbi:MAG: putative DNA binding domain-containing protein [Ruminococcus sp.]|nr:putative DNA binding domain-containing protein [Ruminococcus sp.]
MTENELIEIIEGLKRKKSESNFIEVKSAEKGCPKIFDTLSSFSNQQNGGIIIFGLKESDDFNICGVYDAENLQKRIMEQSLQMEPPIRPLITVVNIDNKNVLSAEIQEIDNFSKPCFYKGAGRLKGSYVRVGDSDRVMTEYEVYSYEAFKRKLEDELRVAQRACWEDIYTNNLKNFIVKLKAQKHNFDSLSDEKILRLQGFITYNREPTLAGIMLFSDYPQAFFPQLCITAVSVPGTQMSVVGNVGERFIDNKRIDGNITQMLDEAIMFVRRNMKTKTVINQNTGKRTDLTEYPVVAIRELIINALVHRDYSIYTDSTPITIKMFSDRIEIENPGGLYGRMTLDQLGKFSADTRNPFIANALEVLGETENRYSGIPTVLNSMAEYGLVPPQFASERGVFRVTLFNSSAKINSSNSEIENEILAFCSTPKSRSEIEAYFKGRMTIMYVMSRYIFPLTDKGLLKRTIPDKPKSKKQKYVSTDL